MSPTFILADMYAQAALHRTTFSALAGAPVQPSPERATSTRQRVSWWRRQPRRPAFAGRPGRAAIQSG
jgi:hypothetical protein